MSIIVAVEVVHIAVLHEPVREGMQVRLCHRFLVGVKAGRLIHVVPDVNVRVAEDVVAFDLADVHVLWPRDVE